MCAAAGESATAAPHGDAAARLPAFDDRTLERQRAETRAPLGLREATLADAEDPTTG